MISRRQLLQWIAGFATAGAMTVGYGIFEPLLRPRVTRYAVRPGGWPSGLDLTIAMIADVHACLPWMSAERIGSIVDTANALGADVIALLGDYVVSDRFYRRFGTGEVTPGEWADALARLRAPLGVHAILGNHDWWADELVQRARQGFPASKTALESVGIPVYNNDVARLAKNGHAFWLAGLGDQLAFAPTRRFHPGERHGVDDLDGTLAKVTDDAPVVLLAHEPDIAMRVPSRVALTLSGHTHGGQVRLFGWSPVVPSRYGNRFAYGYVREPCDLIVSGGLGCSILPIRIGVPPEIVVVTVQAGKPV